MEHHLSLKDSKDILSTNLGLVHITNCSLSFDQSVDYFYFLYWDSYEFNPDLHFNYACLFVFCCYFNYFVLNYYCLQLSISSSGLSCSISLMAIFKSAVFTTMVKHLNSDY